MFSRRPPSWSHLPEQPLAPVPEPAPALRMLLWLRAHGFLFVLVATVVVVAVVFREFSRLSAASDAAAQAQVVQSSQADVPATSRYAALSVTTFPSEADVFLDGDLIGRTPVSRVRLAPGTYTLTVQKSAHARVDSTIEVSPLQMVSLVLPLAEMPVERGARLPQVATSPSDRRMGRRRVATPPATPPPLSATAATSRATPPAKTVAMGRLQLASTPPGAEVWIGGQRVGQTPFTLDLEPGEYVATFKRKGYESPTTVFTVEAGQTRRIAPTLNALQGTVRVLAKPWGTIYLNGQLIQDATNVRVTQQVTPGPVRITVVHPLLGRWERVVQIEPGGEASFVVDLNTLGEQDS